MKKAFAAWKWSLGVVARSYRTVVLLAALIALWVFSAYEWLGLPAESSALLMILSFLWAAANLIAAVGIGGGTVAGAAQAAGIDSRTIPVRSLWTIGGKNLVTGLVYFLLCLALMGSCSIVFTWINGHSVEVASFLTFHAEKPFSHLVLERIYNVVEGLLWIVLSGFLLSFFIALLREGWRGAAKQTGKLLAGATFRTPFLANLLGVVVFGGLAYELATWHPIVPPGFWDYTQMILRFTLVLILLSAGVLFWSLSLARLQLPKHESPQKE